MAKWLPLILPVCVGRAWETSIIGQEQNLWNTESASQHISWFFFGFLFVWKLIRLVRCMWWPGGSEGAGVLTTGDWMGRSQSVHLPIFGTLVRKLRIRIDSLWVLVKWIWWKHYFKAFTFGVEWVVDWKEEERGETQEGKPDGRQLQWHNHHVVKVWISLPAQEMGSPPATIC